MPEGVVVRSTGSHYAVRTQDGRVHDCVAKGNLRIKGFKSTNPIAVGDHVVYETEPGDRMGAVIEVHDRRNYLVRRSVNLSHQKSIIAANLDQAVLMCTLARPRTSTGFMDRFLVTAEAYEVPVVLLFNKIDLYDQEPMRELAALEQAYGRAGYRTVRSSAITGTGLQEVRSLLHGKVTLLSGHSGVGKSTLLNAIQPGLGLRTGEVSETTTKGQHTTTFAEMFELRDDPGTFVIDTPGIKGFGLVDLDAATIADQFPEFFRLRPGCRFSSCTHLHEPGCAVRAAVEAGDVAGFRYRSYVDMANGVDDEKSYRTD